jgi:hypothetical protein
MPRIVENMALVLGRRAERPELLEELVLKSQMTC